MTYLATSNRSGLYYAIEASAGQEPSPLDVQALNQTQNSFNLSQTNTQSNTIRADRQRGELINVENQAGGSFTAELQFGAYDEILEAVFFNTFTVATTAVGTDIAAVVSGSEYKFTSTTTDFTTLNLAKGQYFTVEGFSNTSNNGVFKVAQDFTPTANELKLDSSTPVVNEAAGNTITIKTSKMLENGTTFRTFTFVKSHEDIGQYFVFNGMAANTMTLNVSQGEIPTWEFGFVGKRGRNTSTNPMNSTTPPSTNPVFNPTTNILDARIRGQSVGLINSFSMTINNNINAVFALGSRDAADLVDGSVEITGTMDIFFRDGTEFNRFYNSQSSDVEFRLQDNNGNMYILWIPEFKYQSYDVPVPGINEVIRSTVEFTAYVDPNVGKTIRLDALQ